MKCKFCNKHTSMDSSVGDMALIVCNDCVNKLADTARDICNSSPDCGIEMIITMMILKCGKVCAQENAVRDQRIDELKHQLETGETGEDLLLFR